MPDTGEPQIKLYSELGQAAMRIGQSLAYRLWLLARAADVRGAGHVSIKELLHLTDPILSAQAVKRQLKNGDGIWWRQYPDHPDYWMTSLKTIAERLDVPLRDHPVAVPIHYFKKLSDFHAVCIASIAASRPRTIARKKLGMIYGRSVHSMSNYTERAKALNILTIKQQTAITSRPTDQSMYGWLSQEGYYVARVNSQAYAAKRLPNQYACQLETLPFGQIKRLHGTSLTTKGQFRKVFYTEDSKGLSKALNGLGAGEQIFVLGAPAEESDSGMALWHIWERQDGPDGLSRVIQL